MSTYDAFRHFADSWGLVMMAAVFVTFTGWTFLPSVRDAHRTAATSIFEPEDAIDG
ncbi:cbb3-type cytochrome c oxidase subunit 3 [Sphingomonas qomolangmaensis]|uniref:Cbb3-type cytochrome c oxidase subunit 3 n=1 Tax=Sphingomonas qomolangmaensis TaxID=2918765 RepID=A0ABY5LDS6_9SPHN|nr:cbb3-type cytochrome c oxidase subunit 3 [Sphingomonas qomolangmaensis]UUL84047.1 cbb3-type cytochrome c oxidase subunit 3 [Sphingomonas qomolangmaensis]